MDRIEEKIPPNKITDGTEGEIRLVWWQYTLAIVLILLSMISKVTLYGVEVAGGSTIAALAAIVLLGPLFRQLGEKGGHLEVVGLKLQIEKLEKRTVEDNVLRLEELRTDVEELRQQLSVGTKNSSVPKSTTWIEPDEEHILASAIEEYRDHQAINDWRARAEIDNRLVARSGRLPPEKLKKILDESPHDREAAMAVALSLGLPHPSDDENESVRLLIKLLDVEHERVRYRAALSIARRGRRTDTSQEARHIMLEGIRSALRKEHARDVLESLEKALTALTTSS